MELNNKKVTRLLRRKTNFDKLEEILSDDLKDRIIECDRKIRQFI